MFLCLQRKIILTTTKHHSMHTFYKHRAADISPVLIDTATKLRVLRMFSVNYMYIIHILWFLYFWGRSGRDRMVVGFIITYAINDPYQFYL